MPRRRVAILISGRGTNMAALIDAAQDPSYPAEIALVLSNRPDAAGLLFAKENGIATAVLNHKEHSSRESFDFALDTKLKATGIEIVCLAGFMRLLTPDFVEGWRDRMINIHPSLLPLFPGLDTHERALAAGMKLHGATVHFVRAAVDSGPIIAQAAVPVLTGDTPETLAARVLTAEHRIYPLALSLLASGKARVVDEKVVIDAPSPEAEGVLVAPSYL
jgi:phosphoribosylglycinamide formyltransferase-1